MAIRVCVGGGRGGGGATRLKVNEVEQAAMLKHTQMCKYVAK